MFEAFLVCVVLFLAYSNGANDNFKGVASLFGSRTCSYQTAIVCATVTTGAGSVAAIFLARTLMLKFSGKGLVPDALVAEHQFLLSVALGAGLTVILASLIGFPISTTHSLVGALLGAGLVGSPASVSFRALGKSFVSPLLFSPLIAVAGCAALYTLLHALRLRLKIGKDVCVCVGSGKGSIATPQGSLMTQSSKMEITAGSVEECHQTYTGHFFGISARMLIDGLHFLSAGAVSFARGLNDTPKIAALLLLAPTLNIKWGLLAISAAIATGGLLNARKVAYTMSNQITEMNRGQGLCANLATSILVNTANYHGLPVSTTHVSVGALVGIGVATGQTKWKPVLNIVLSWIVTLPCAGVLAAVAYASLRLL